MILNSKSSLMAPNNSCDYIANNAQSAHSTLSIQIEPNQQPTLLRPSRHREVFVQQLRIIWPCLVCWWSVSMPRPQLKNRTVGCVFDATHTQQRVARLSTNRVHDSYSCKFNRINTQPHSIPRPHWRRSTCMPCSGIVSQQRAISFGHYSIQLSARSSDTCWNMCGCVCLCMCA